MGKSQQVWSRRTILLNRLQGLVLSFGSGPTSEAQPARPCLHGLANLSAFIPTTPHLSCFKAATKLQIPVSEPPWSHLSKGCFLAESLCLQLLPASELSVSVLIWVFPNPSISGWTRLLVIFFSLWGQSSWEKQLHGGIIYCDGQSQSFSVHGWLAPLLLGLGPGGRVWWKTAVYPRASRKQKETEEGGGVSACTSRTALSLSQPHPLMLNQCELNSGLTHERCWCWCWCSHCPVISQGHHHLGTNPTTQEPFEGRFLENTYPSGLRLSQPAHFTSTGHSFVLASLSPVDRNLLK